MKTMQRSFNAEEDLESIWKFCLMSQEYAYRS